MYGDSHALSSDSRPILFSSNSTPKLEELLMESDSNYTSNSSGLLRYRSAPTSLLSNFAEKSANFSSRFCSSDDNEANNNTDHNNNNMNVFEENDEKYNRLATVMNNNTSQLPPQYPRQMGSFCVDPWNLQGKIGSNLARQNSSPAGLMFSQNGYSGAMRGIGRSYRMVDNGANGELSDPNSNLNSCRTNLPSLLGPLSRISELEHESCGDDQKGVNDNLLFSSWNDSSHTFADNVFNGGIKREMDDDQKLFGNTQNGNRPHILSHHLSLPKNSADQMAAMEKLLQLQDTVPCKIRAKRGCATHPRSIAERVRRTRISERMRKLQELVPNMDKQTNTADMLDLAVDYIKNLQGQYKILSDTRANCKCAASQKAVLNQTH